MLKGLSHDQKDKNEGRKRKLKGRDTAALVSVIIQSHKWGVFLDSPPLSRPVRPVQNELPDVHSAAVQLRMSHSAQLLTERHRNTLAHFS